MTDYTLHQLVKKGETPRVRAMLDAMAQGEEIGLNAPDPAGYTPLMHAVRGPAASVELVRLLLDSGADVHQEMPRADDHPSANVMSLALGAGDPPKVRLLLERGADLHYQRGSGYDALIDAVHGRDILGDERLLELLRLLIAQGAKLNGATTYNESGCRTLSRVGRFDAVGLLLAAGADAEPLRWTPLMRAVALGSLADVQVELGNNAAFLEGKDWWDCTAWHLAIKTGDLAKTRLLLEHGADTNAKGRCGQPSLFYAIATRHLPMLRWLLEIGAKIEETDEFGSTALMEAAEQGNLPAVEALLKAGANVHAERNEQTALSFAEHREIIVRLLDAGADPQHLPFAGRRALLGFTPEPDETLLDVSPADFTAGRSRRFGGSNPEQQTVPFWEAMIRSGIDAYQAAKKFGEGKIFNRSPIWCARRFGQSITFLPDGRIVQIAGEHEDHYDPDFCIYNDVFVHAPDGTIRIYGYPEKAFSPTDFHTATLLGESIYVIGSLGYPHTRRQGQTPVYRLDTQTFHVEQIQTEGPEPGWIYEHKAVAISPHEIRITGGTVWTWDGQEQGKFANPKSFVFDVKKRRWTVEAVKTA